MKSLKVKSAIAHITMNTIVLKKNVPATVNTITKVPYMYIGGAQAKQTARNKAVASYWNMVNLMEVLAFVCVFGKQAEKEQEMKDSQERMKQLFAQDKAKRLGSMDKVFNVKNATIAQEDGLTIIEGEGFVSAKQWIEYAKINVEVTKAKEAKMTKGYQFTTGNEDMEYQAYCYNMYCSSRDKSLVLQYLISEMSGKAERLNKGQGMLRNLYKTMFKKYSSMIISKPATVVKITEGELAGCMTVNMLDARLKYSHYKQDGNANNGTKAMFTGKFGYDMGIKLFNEYASDLKTFEKYMNLAFGILEDMKQIGIAIAEAKAVKGKAPVINVQYVHDADGNSTAVCPHCGEPVRQFTSKVVNHLGVDKDAVTNELKNQKYDMGNGRFVTLDSNGNIVSDTDNMAIHANDVVETEIDAFDFNDKDMSAFESAFNTVVNSDGYTGYDVDMYNEGTLNYYEGDEGEEFDPVTNVSNETMDAFWAMAGEDINDASTAEYNDNVKADKNESKWNRIRHGMGIVEAAWMFSYGNNEFFKAGGYMSEFAMYEMSCVEGLDYSKCYDMLKFKSLAGGAFNISDDVLTTLKHFEYTATKYREDTDYKQDLVRGKAKQLTKTDYELKMIEVAKSKLIK